MAAGEVERVDSRAERLREGHEVVSDPFEPFAVELLSGQLVVAVTQGVDRAVEAFAPGLELVNGDRAPLVGVEESVPLLIELA